MMCRAASADVKRRFLARSLLGAKCWLWAAAESARLRPMNRHALRGAVLALSLVTGCARKWTCDLAGQLEERAGTGARNCGESKGDAGSGEAERDADVPGDAGASPVDDCVASALRAHQAFYAQYPLAGKGATLVYGVASDGEGTVTILQYDPNPSGGSNQDPTIRATECMSPEFDPSSTRNSGSPAPLHCASITQLGQTCGQPSR